MRGFHIIVGLGLLAVIVWMIFNKGDETQIVSITGLASISLVIMPATIIFSLNMEVHELVLFLYRRNTIAKMIHIKFLHGFLNSVVFFIATLLLAFILKLFNRIHFNLSDFFQEFAFNMLDFGLISIVGSILLYCAWVLQQWLKYKIGASISMVIIIALIYQCTYLIPMIGDFLTFFSGLWKVKYNVFYESNQLILEENYISFSYIIALILLLILIYSLVTLLLKRKVEV